MPDEFKKVAQVSDIPENSVKVFSLNGHEIAVCHNSDGLYAIDDLCTHDNGPLGAGELIDGQIECPRHGARFDVKTGKALCLPAVRPVRTYKLEVRGNEIWIST